MVVTSVDRWDIKIQSVSNGGSAAVHPARRSSTPASPLPAMLARRKSNGRTRGKASDPQHPQATGARPRLDHQLEGQIVGGEDEREGRRGTDAGGPVG